jgi:hypothetical protein
MDTLPAATAKYYIVTSNEVFHKSTNLFKINYGTLKYIMHDPHDCYPKAVCYLKFFYNSRIGEVEVRFINAKLMQVKCFPSFTPLPS